MTDHENTPTGIRGLITPRQTWRRLGGAAKFVLYTRISIQSLIVMSYGWMVVSLVIVAGNVGLPAGSVALTVLGTGAVVILGVMAVELQPDLNTRPRRPVRPVFRVGLVLAAVVFIPSLLTQLPGGDGPVRGFGLMTGMSTLFIFYVAWLPWLRRRWLLGLVLTVAAGAVFQGADGGSITFIFIPVFGLFLLGTVALSLWTVNLMKEVEDARRTEAELRVAEERLRFAQELHDTLGQHLAGMSVKAELALALARRGDDRLEGELEQLQQLSRTSMSEMREVVEGYRAVNLATEVAGAVSLLRDAEVELQVSGDALDVAENDRELAAWFVREATTNVLRHAHATTVRLELRPDLVRMSNDGAPGTAGRLSGLGALRRRATDHGARLLVEKDGETFTATVALGRACDTGETDKTSATERTNGA